MILIGGLTPAWQHILVFDQLSLGRVNRASRTVWCASGKVLNAGLAAYHLNGLARVLAAVGGRTRRQIEDDLEAYELDYRWVVTEAPTRVCVTIIDRSQSLVTELVEEAAPLTRAELDQFWTAWREEAAKAKVAILIGSLPPETPAGYFAELLRVSPRRVIVDCAGPALLESLERQPFLVKPNREELARTLNRPVVSDDEILQAMRDLRARGAQRVLITDGPGAAWFVGPEGTFRILPPRPIQWVNPIGCGDALAGALGVALGQGKDIVEALRFGIAAAVDNLEQLLPCRLRPSRVAELVHQVVIESVG